MSARANFHIAALSHAHRTVWIVDENLGGVSVTNDAEAVVAELVADPNLLGADMRIIYRDSDGNWDELVHERGVFKAFKPARDVLPRGFVA